MASVIQKKVYPSTALTAASTNGEGVGLDAKVGQFVGFLTVSAINAATTATVKIQDSPDKTNWTDVITFAAVAGAVGFEKKDITAKLLPYVRAVITLAGVTKAATVEVSIYHDITS